MGNPEHGFVQDYRPNTTRSVTLRIHCRLWKLAREYTSNPPITGNMFASQGGAYVPLGATNSRSRKAVVRWATVRYGVIMFA